MTSISQARQDVYDRWNTLWSYTLFIFDNESSEALDKGAVAWARMVIREIPGGQSSLGPKGGRRYLRRAIMFVQIFTPVDTGAKAGGDLGHNVRTLFEGERFGGVVFNDVQVREGLPEAKWHVTLAEAAFDFEEIK